MQKAPSHRVRNKSFPKVRHCPVKFLTSEWFRQTSQFLSFELSSRVFSGNFVSAVFVIETLINFIAINEVIEQTSCQVKKFSLLKIKTINKNKKWRSYQVIEPSGFGFWSHKRSKRTRNKVFIKSQKIPVSNFIAINQAKEQGTNVLSRHRNFPFWFLKP